MSEQKKPTTDTPVSVNRRVFLTLTVAVSGQLAGCSGETKTTPNREEDTDRPRGSDDSDAVTSVEGKIEEVYERIEEVPLVEDGEFVYELENSMESVDHEEMVKIAKDALNAAHGLDRHIESSEQIRESFQRSAKVSFLLVDQLFLVHKALVGGLVFRRAYSEGRYGRSVEVIDEAREILERLRANVRELEEEVTSDQNLNLTMTKLDVASIISTLEVVLEILQWWIPVFEGFEFTATGMVAVHEGNQELEQERFGPAQGYYDQAQRNFARAESAFNTAHGRGQHLEYLVPIVNDLRCLVPILATGYDELDKGFSELESGNEEKGLEIAEETLIQLDKDFNKCL